MAFDFYLLDYNNYYNRQLKKLDTLNEYINGGYLLNAFFNKNFDFNDGVNSSIVINYQGQVKTPNYCIIVDEATLDFTRWFVIDERKERGSQYTFTLRRDVMADFKDSVLNSTYFIERGYASNTNPLVFNQEDFRFNKIKKAQMLLKDETDCPWIVGFIPSDFAKDEDKKISAHNQGSNADYQVVNLNEFSIEGTNMLQFSKIPGQGTSPSKMKVDEGTYNGVSYNRSNVYTLNQTYSVHAYDSRFSDRNWYLICSNYFNYIGQRVDQSNQYASGFSYYTVGETAFDNFNRIPNMSLNSDRATQYLNYHLNSINTNYFDDFLNELKKRDIYQSLKSTYAPQSDLIKKILTDYDGKTLYDRENDTTYKMSVEFTGVNSHNYDIAQDSTLGIRLKSCVNPVLNELTYNDTYGRNNAKFVVSVNALEAQLVLTKLEDGQYTEIKLSRNHLEDAPYDMFCMPYSDELQLQVPYDGQVYTFTSNKDLNYNIAAGIISTLGAADTLCDLQLLPYCPIRTKISGDNIVLEESDVSFIMTDNPSTRTPIGAIVWAKSSSGTIEELKGKNGELYNILVDNYKKSNCLEEYRLCAPSYASVFEFSPAKNYGVESFQVSYTYKPHTSYIKVKPKFKGLYGENFKDQRGLILQGDFSMPQLTSAWETYQLQNKNYMNTFDREIQSMEYQKNMGFLQNNISGAAGSLTGVGAGMLLGGPVGAAIGGMASLSGGIMDAFMSRQMAEEGIAKAKQLFNYSIENIQAMPSTIKNVGAYTIDNLKFPFVEVYSCTQEEEEMFEMNIKYNGMTINTVGKIKDYYNTNEESFVKGTLIRLEPGEDIVEDMDTHLARTINEEINKGIYIGG